MLVLVKIFEYSHDDHEALTSFKAEAWPVADKEHYGDTVVDFSRSEHTFIAKDGERIVGYCTVALDAGVAQIEPLMVAPDRKGQGIGTALLKRAEEKAIQEGAHKIWLETGMSWKSKAFYEKGGYVVRAVLPNHVAHQDFVLMDKML